MITLNAEKELVRIESWEDVISRPGFVTDLDPATAKLDAIIGSYFRDNDVKCGLTSCHQPHRKGYLVTTKDGRETNIGNICGKTYFSVEFEALRRTFDREVRIKAQKETLQAFQSRTPEYELHIVELREGPAGADWIHKNVTALRTPGRDLPERLRSELVRMTRDGDARLMRQREATAQEIEDEEAILGGRLERPYYVSEHVGIVDGLQALNEDSDLRKLLILDLTAGIERIASMDVTMATEHQLATEARWVAELDGKLERAERLVEVARRLLTKRNLAQLANLLEDEKEVRALRTAISHLPDVNAT